MYVELPHRVLWKKRVSDDSWGDKTYGDSLEIPARIERRSRIRQSSSGDERVDDTRIMVGAEHPVSTDDLLDGSRVEATDEQVNMSGDVIGYICYLEGR